MACRRRAKVDLVRAEGLLPPHRPNASHGLGSASPGSTQKILGLTAQLEQVGPGGKVTHRISPWRPWGPLARPKEITVTGSTHRRGGLSPARGPGGRPLAPSIQPSTNSSLTFQDRSRVPLGIHDDSQHERSGQTETIWRILAHASPCARALAPPPVFTSRARGWSHRDRHDPGLVRRSRSFSNYDHGDRRLVWPAPCRLDQ
jgi:hypothetical protein